MCAFGALIKEPLLSDYELLNVHPSLLPRWRGAAPIERAIMAGDERDRGLDHAPDRRPGQGPVCLAGARADRPDDTYGSLAARLEVLGAELLLARARRARRRSCQQHEEGATYAEKISRGRTGRSIRRAPARSYERVVRALHPHIGARVDLGEEGMLGVHAARALAPGAGGPRAS